MRIAATCAALLLLGSCAWQPLVPVDGPIPTILESVRVPRLAGKMSGTATPIDEHRYLTARHVLPVDSTWHRLDNSISNHEVLQHGRGTGLGEDWIVFRSETETERGNRSIMPIDFDTAPRTGETVYVIGYGWAAGERDGDEPNILRCVVNTPPIPIPERTFVFRGPSSEMRYGMSGGPVVAIRDGRPIVVGMVRSQNQVEGYPHTHLFLAVRPKLELRPR